MLPSGEWASYLRYGMEIHVRLLCALLWHCSGQLMIDLLLLNVLTLHALAQLSRS